MRIWLALLLAISVAMVPVGAGAAEPESFRLVRSFGEPTRTWGASLVDYDLDGRSDLFLNWHNARPPSLLQNLGSLAFKQPTIPWIYPMDRHVCAWGEANGDGSPDLACVQGARGGHGQGPNELWSANPWREWAVAGGIENPLGRTRTVNWLDYDRDGRLDLFTGGIARDTFGDQLYRNDHGVFTPVDAGISGLRQTVGSSWADWNRDHYPDLLLLESVDGSNARFFENNQGTFKRIRFREADGHWISAAWGDFDGDGWPDLHLVDSGRSLILRNDHGTFRSVDAEALHRGRASAWLDVNNDGLLDLYVVQTARGRDPGSVGDASDLLLIQDRPGHFSRISLPETRGWEGAGDAVGAGDVNDDYRSDVLVSNGRARWKGPQQLLINRMSAGKAARLVLRGTPWNPLGFGARLRVVAGGMTYWRGITDGVAGKGQSSNIQHISLGSADAARVRVRWMGGACDELRILAGTTRVLRIGTRSCG